MIDKIIEDLSIKYNKDKRVIKAIAYHPFLFYKKIAYDVNDGKSIMIPYFGKFVLRYGKTNQDKINNTNNNLRIRAEIAARYKANENNSATV